MGNDVKSNDFLEKQKIPSVLERYFQAYIETGDYSQLIAETTEYIRQNKNNSEQIIHILEFEKQRLVISQENQNSIVKRFATSIVSSAITALISFVCNMALKDYVGVIGIIAPLVSYIVFIVATFFVMNFMKKTIDDDTLQQLKNKEKINFLNICIELYKKQVNPSTS